MARNRVRRFGVDAAAAEAEAAQIEAAEAAADFMDEATDIAMAAMQGLLASGKYSAENARSAVALAWMECVPAFIEQKRDFPDLLVRLGMAVRAVPEIIAAE